MTLAAVTHGPAASAKTGRKVRSCIFQNWNETEEKSGDERNRNGEEQHGRVYGNVVETRKACRTGGNEDSQAAIRKANAERAMAMSWAFSGNCRQTVNYEQMVFEYYVSTKDSYQQGEMADEAARVCIDNGDLDTAYQWYKTGHDAGLKQPDIAPERKNLWEFRWEHAQARIAARRGNRAEADKHVAAAKALLDRDAGMARQQASFFPYLAGYVALYRGDYRAALEQLRQANQNDPFIQCLMGDSYDKLGQKDQAMECYRKAAAATAHNPPAAFARPYALKKLATP